MIKWLSNFWYHYKFRTILCLFLAVVVGVSIFEIATREKYDLTVYLYLSQGISDDVERSLEETIEQIYKENGEEKNVQVINFSYDPYSNNGDSKMSYASALTGEIQMKKNFLFITDSYRFEELNENDSFINLFNKEDFFNKYDNKAFSIKETNFESKFIKNLKEEGLYYAVVSHKTAGRVLIVIEPNERLVSALKKFIPRTVQNDVFGH